MIESAILMNGFKGSFTDYDANGEAGAINTLKEQYRIPMTLFECHHE